MLPLIAQTAFSTVLGLWMAELFRAKEKTETKEKAEVGSLDNALRLARVRRLASVGAEGNPGKTGHYVPLDAQMLEEALSDIAREVRASLQGSPEISGSFERTTMDYGSIGADIMFGAASDSDVLEALSVSGAYDIVGGDGSSEIIGAELIGAASAGNPRAKAALRQIAMRNAGAVVKNDLKNRRRYPLGFVPTEVDSGDAATIPAAPQNLFRPERLVIPSDICFDFGVQDIKVGNQSQFAQSVEVPAAVFSEVSIDTNVTFDTAEVGNQISILVRNKGTTDNLEFTAAALGTIAKA